MIRKKTMFLLAGGIFLELIALYYLLLDYGFTLLRLPFLPNKNQIRQGAQVMVVCYLFGAVLIGLAFCKPKKT